MYLDKGSTLTYNFSLLLMFLRWPSWLG